MEKPDALSAADVLATYQQAWTLTQRMLELARKAEWDALVATEGERNLLVEKLRLGDKAEEKSPAFLDSKASLIRNILAADEEIRTLSGDWIVELRGILDDLGVKKKSRRPITSSPAKPLFSGLSGAIAITYPFRIHGRSEWTLW